MKKRLSPITWSNIKFVGKIKIKFAIEINVLLKDIRQVDITIYYHRSLSDEQARALTLFGRNRWPINPSKVSLLSFPSKIRSLDLFSVETNYSYEFIITIAIITYTDNMCVHNTVHLGNLIYLLLSSKYLSLYFFGKFMRF